MNPAEPHVVVQHQGQPQVRYERTGQAQVRVEQQGKEQAAAGAAAGATAPAPAAQPAAGVPLQQVTNLIGNNVVGANGHDAGEVQDFLLDRSGNVRAAVVEWGFSWASASAGPWCRSRSCSSAHQTRRWNST